MNRRNVIGWTAWGLFLASIPFANWWLHQHGFWDSPILGPLPSALWVVAVSFVLRDIAQISIGRLWAWAAIAIGVVLTFWLATPGLAVASGVAFAISESTDALIFTPLANRGRFLIAVTVSGYIAGFVDSAVFLRIAFHSWQGWWQLGIAKAIVLMVATPFAWMARRALLRDKLDARSS